jgi:hypothetical protein
VHVVLLLFDAARAHAQGLSLSRRELALAGAALDEGKALLLVANKADLLQQEQLAELLESVAATLDRMFLVAGRLPTVALSALEVGGSSRALQQQQQRRRRRRFRAGAAASPPHGLPLALGPAPGVSRPCSCRGWQQKSVPTWRPWPGRRAVAPTR